PPMAIMVSFIPFSMSLMIAAMPTRLATRRMMPSMVRTERNLWDQTSLRPTVMVLERVTGAQYWMLDTGCCCIASFISQSLNWIQPRRFHGGEKARDDADERAEAERDRHRERGDDRSIFRGRE